MSISEVRALTFDTGGTILDWHTGFETVLAETGARHELERNWHDIANSLRRKGLGKMLNLGKGGPPGHNFDGAHRMALDELIEEHDLAAFTEAERDAALAAVEAEDGSVNRGLLLKFLGSVDS